MKNSDKIPSPLADKLDAFEFPFDETAWASFEALRPADKPKPPYRFWGLGLMMVGLGVALFFYNKKDIANAGNNTAIAVVFDNKITETTQTANTTTPISEGKKEGNNKIFSTDNTQVLVVKRKENTALLNNHVPKIKLEAPLSISQQKIDKNTSKAIFEDKTKVNGVKIFNSQGLIPQNLLLNIDTPYNLLTKDSKAAAALNTNDSDTKVLEQQAVTGTMLSPSVANKETNQEQRKESNAAVNATHYQENREENTAVNNAAQSGIILTKATTTAEQSLGTTAISPLSILPFLDTLFSEIAAQSILIPSMTKPLPILTGPKNSLRLGSGLGLIGSDVGTASAFTMTYLHRFTPLMSLGLNTTHANKNNNKTAYVFSTDVQLNFTFCQRRRFNVDITTGYGYRSWFFNDANQKGEAKGITLGLEANYCFLKDYFVGLRVDRKITYYKNTGFYVQVGKYF